MEMIFWLVVLGAVVTGVHRWYTGKWWWTVLWYE
jgi:hypothetical protein